MATITISKLVAALKTVPEKRFSIMDIAPQLLDDAGNVDVEKCLNSHGELNLAITEVETYVRSVHALKSKVEYLGGKAVNRNPFEPFGGDENDDVVIAEVEE